MKHANIALFIPHAGCPHACSFCNQRVISGKNEPVSPQQAVRELEEGIAHLGKRAQEAQLAFFGGSFTAIDREYMLALLDAVYPYVADGRISGVRCSTRPDCIDEQVLCLLRERGVRTIELGAQSMVDRVLELNERGHTAQQVCDASRLIKAHGFELGLQMMTGLYGDSDEGAEYTARRLAELEPDCVRIYPTVVLRGTKLAGLVDTGEYQPPGVEQTVPLCARLLEFFHSRGIPVIKLGLHAECSVESEYVAGAYHPALRELCESRVYLERAVRALGECASSSVDIYVAPGSVSKMTGQKRCNISSLSRMGYDVRIRTDSSLGIFELAVKERK